MSATTDLPTSAPPDGEQSDSPPRPPSAWQRFWHRYSPNGEFPLSSCSSLAIHVLLVLLLILMARVLDKHERPAPGVDVVQVGDEPNAAAGLQAGGPGDATSLAETTPADASPADSPDRPGEELRTDVASDAASGQLVADDAVSSEVSQAAQRAAQSAERARAGLARAKSRLAKNMSQGGGTAASGGGNAAAGNTPGGGGSGATGRAARPGRWILRFRSISVEDLLNQYAGLSAELAFPTAGDRFRFFYNLSLRPPPSRVQGLEKESRLYWQEDNPQSLSGLTQYLGLPMVSYMLCFLPRDVEDKMARMETAYAGLREDQIASTTFEVVRRGGGYDVQVVEQKPK